MPAHESCLPSSHLIGQARKLKSPECCEDLTGLAASRAVSCGSRKRDTSALPNATEKVVLGSPAVLI
jgi:hypothetical protein